MLKNKKFAFRLFFLHLHIRTVLTKTRQKKYNQLIRIETLAELYTQIIPNPASDIVTIVSPYSLKHIEIYDLKGHRIHSIESDGHSSELSVSSLASGTYIVAIHSDGGMITRKLVVSHNKQ